jgi:hypothetical protein
MAGLFWGLLEKLCEMFEAEVPSATNRLEPPRDWLRLADALENNGNNNQMHEALDFWIL